MSMFVRLGNLINNTLAGDYDAIMHGCNCFHGEDAGFAKQVWHSFPEARQSSIDDHEGGDFAAFGTYSMTYYKELGTTIINAYTQYHGGPSFNIDAFINILKQVNEDFEGCVIGVPLIGAGIGGGDWVEIQEAMLRYAPNIGWRVIVWNGL